MIENADNKLYMLYGADYMLIPEQLRMVLLSIYDLHVENQEFLLPLEEGIKKTYGKYREPDHKKEKGSSQREERRCLQLLLSARRQVLNKMFHLTEDTYNQFLVVNNTLKDLSIKTRNKIRALYNSWLKDEETEWRNDCQVSGSIIAEGWQEIGADETGSDFDTMIEIIEEIGRRELFTVDFSGSPDFKLDNNLQYLAPIDSCRLFSLGGSKPYGDFTMCRAFDTLYTDSLYSKQDILRIKMFWADVNFTHQRIVTPQGELL